MREKKLEEADEEDGVEEKTWHRNVKKISLREEKGRIALLFFQNACSLFCNGTQVNLNQGDVYTGMC